MDQVAELNAIWPIISQAPDERAQTGRGEPCSTKFLLFCASLSVQSLGLLGRARGQYQ